MGGEGGAVAGPFRFCRSAIPVPTHRHSGSVAVPSLTCGALPVSTEPRRNRSGTPSMEVASIGRVCGPHGCVDALKRACVDAPHF